MKKLCTILLLVLCLLFVVACAEDGEHIFDATADLAAMAQGMKADGDSDVVKDYFTILYSAKTKIDGSSKTFDDGYSATQRLNFGGKTQPGKGMINSVKFTVDGPATVRLWWVSGGDTRQFALYNGACEIIAKTEVNSLKNALYITDFQLEGAGDYYLGVPDGSNYLFKIQVTTGQLETVQASRLAWAAVKMPMVFVYPEDVGNGKMVASLYADIGYDGGDEAFVSMVDSQGNVIETRRTIAEQYEHRLEFTPPATGEYTFTAELHRAGEEPKFDPGWTESFVLPLGTPTLTSAASMGAGSIHLVWTAVPEATEIGRASCRERV